jgi:hypothetical protein
MAETCSVRVSFPCACAWLIGDSIACVHSHGQGNRPSGQSKTAIKIAATTTKVSITAVVVGRIGCVANLKARLETGPFVSEQVPVAVDLYERQNEPPHPQPH